MAEAIAGGNPQFDWVHIDKEEGEIPCEVRLVRFPPYDKQLLRASIIDKREEIRIGEALRESEDRLKLALTVTGLGTYDFYPLENRTFWDEGMLKIFGAPNEIGKDFDYNGFFFAVLHPADRERVLGEFEKAYNNVLEGSTFDDEYRIIKNGVTHYIKTQGYYLRNADNKIYRIIGTVRDVSAERSQEEQLRYQAALLERVTDAVISTDATFIVKSWNPAAERLYGWKAEEVIGRPFSKVIKADYLDLTREEVVTSFWENKKWEGEVLHHHHDGNSIYVQSTVTAIYDEQQRAIGTIAINKDISKRRKAEEALKVSEARYRALAENFPNGLIALYDHDLRYTVVNGQGLAQIGLTSADLEGKRLRDVFF